MGNVNETKKERPIELALAGLDNQIDDCQAKCDNLNERLQSVLGTIEPKPEKTEPKPISGNSTLEQKINKMRDAIENITADIICILDRLQI